jgi:putative Mg2+ transporter-C (MgtC) family protein
MLTAQDVAIRLALSVLAGAVVGFERESHGRAAGLRTTMLVCVSAALAMLISVYLMEDAAAHPSLAWRPDPGRLAQGILAGMGFLGAGAIIKEGKVVRGVTTAAVLWFVTVLGLAFGSGYLLLGLAGMGIAMLALFVLPKIEALIANDWYGVVIVTVQGDQPTDEHLCNRIEEAGASVKKMDFEEDVRSNTRVVRCELKYKKADLFALSARVRGAIRKLPGVVHLKWE